MSVPPALFRGADVLEFGPDSGENAVVFARWGARLTLVEVQRSPSLFFAGMEGSRIPIATAHGEGYAEFRDAAELVPAPFGAIARMAHAVVQFGSKLSPLHDRFPGKLVEEASTEAAELTALKAELH